MGKTCLSNDWSNSWEVISTGCSNVVASGRHDRAKQSVREEAALAVGGAQGQNVDELRTRMKQLVARSASKTAGQLTTSIAVRCASP